MIISVRSDAKPMCPNKIGGTNPAHRAVVAAMDAVFAEFETNELGEYLHDDEEEVKNAYIAGLLVDAGMDLFHEFTATPGKTILAYYYRCPVCEFVLSATSVESPLG